MTIASASALTRKKSLALSCVLILAFVVYATTLRNGFVYDDHHQVEENPYTQSVRYLGKIFSGTVWSFQGEEGQTNYYRPLMTLAFLLSNKAFQSLPYGFHLVNILLNCAVVWLVFLLCWTLFGDEMVAVLAAVAFAVHPIHTEVVAWIAAITELELAVFYLGAFLLFLRLGSEKAHKRRVQALMCACFALALLSKEQALTLLPVAMTYEHFYRSDRAATSLKTKASRYAAFWIMGGAYLLFRITVLGGAAPVLKHPDVSWPQAFLSGLALAGSYVAKLFWPHPLLAFYVFHKSTSLSDTGVLVGVAVAVVAAGLFILLWRHGRNYSFVLLWIALTLLPVLNPRWMATNVFAERYLYLPSVGFCALAAGGALWLYRKFAVNTVVLRWALAAVGVAVALLASEQVVARSRDWRDDYTLFTRTLATEPRASNVRSDLGALEWNLNHHEKAVREWRQALVDDPNNPIALANLGLAMLEQKNYTAAKEYLDRTIALRPHYAAPHIHLGHVYLAEGNTVAAGTELRRAVEIYPLSTQARNALGKFYFDQGDLNNAEAQYRASTESLNNAEAWGNLGDIYFRMGLAPKAEQAWCKTLELSPYDSHAHLALGAVYSASGRSAEAKREYQAVLLMDPKNADALKAISKLNGGRSSVQR
jgi:tetratricopeptide (TPR) repeat protein